MIGGEGRMKKIGAVFSVIAAVALLAFLAWDAVFNESASKSFFAMDTVISAHITGRNAEDILSETEKCVSELDSSLSRHDPDSEISLLNRNSGGMLSDRLSGYFRILLDVSKKSGGAFDFTLGAVSDLWSFGNSPKIPDEAELKKALSESGYKKASLSGNSLVIGGGVIDFGAVGKGIALDEIRDIIEKNNIREAVISVGGSVLLYGNETAKVGIRSPFGDSGSSIATLSLSDVCISTSGSYERKFEENGKAYHHIINPETGYPVENGLVSVTVISDSGILSDALSTACFVLGKEKGIALAEEYGCDAVFIDENKNITVTEGIHGLVEVTDSSYSLVAYEK